MKRRRETSASRNRRLLEVNLCRENHGDWNSVQHRRFVSPLFDAVDRSFDKKRMARLSEDLIDAWERLRETASEFGEQRIYASTVLAVFAAAASGLAGLWEQ